MVDPGGPTQFCPLRSSPGVQAASRTPLVLLRSAGEGRAWEQACTLEDGAGEYSYPALARVEGGFACAWTRRREGLGFARFRWP